MRSELVLDGSSPIGAILQLSPPTDRLCTPRRSRNHPPFGWESLTDTERSVSELVAQGLTNRETSERLFMSPHTVGFHLRSIYRKLDVRSRVDLARLAAERAQA